MFMRVPLRMACAFLLSCIAMLTAKEGWANLSLSPDAVTFSSLPTGSYQEAKATFLPDLKDSEFGFPDNKLGGDINIKNCDGYTTGSCPAKAICQRCPFDGSKIKILGCASNWTYKNGSCIPNSCTAINSSYKDSIPNNNICTNFTEYSRTCYKNCRAVSCSGYTVSCSNKPEHVTSVAKCPDCQNSANSKCGDNVCKVTACEDKYKINSNATGCILKDDTCPSGYNKTCETGTQGDPRYTEMGTACYQCKPKIETCAQYVAATFPNKTLITTMQELQHALVDNKNDFVLANSLTLTADIDLSGKTIVGANEIASASPLCTSKLTITTNKSIKTNDSTVMKNFKLVSTRDDGKHGSETSVLNGGGSFYNLEIISDKYYVYVMDLKGRVKLYNTTFSSGYPIRIQDKANVTFYGNTTINKVATFYGSGIITVKGAPTITLEGTIKNYGPFYTLIDGYDATVTTPTYNIKALITCDNEERSYELFSSRGGTINVNNSITCPKGGINFGAGTLNINAASTIGRIQGKSNQTTNPSKHATANINAATTIDANNYEAISMSFHATQPDTLKINAPLTIINAPKDKSSYPTAVMKVNTLYINSDVNFGGGFPFDYISTHQITYGANANLKNASRIYWKKQYSSVKFIYNAGAKLTLGGVCRKVTSYTTTSRKTMDPTDEWKTPQSPFTGGC